MEWKLTDYLALWGAIVATCVAGWNIYRDFLKRDRVEVYGGFRLSYDGYGGAPQPCFVVSVINHTDKPLRVTHVGGYEYGRWSRLFLAKIMRRKKAQAYLLPFATLNGELPFAVASKDRVDITYAHTPDIFPDVRQLTVTTADGREWSMGKRSMKAIRAEMAEVKAKAKAKAAS
jgi:hypothetical protein